MIEKALADAQVQIKNLEALAVALGPGQQDNLRVGIDLAQAIGKKYDIPVISVNHLEAHIMTKRMEAVQQMEEATEFDVEFPFISVIVTGAHTEILLTRGVGLHTVLGYNIDIALGNLLDRCADEVIKYCRKYLGLNFEGGTTDEPSPTPEQKKRLIDFCEEFTKKTPGPKVHTSDIWDLCNKKVTGGPLIEALARYGDSSLLEKVPVSKLFDTNLTMSYAGTETWFKRRLYGQPEGYKTLQEIEQKELSFQEICNLCSALQFSAFNQV